LKNAECLNRKQKQDTYRAKAPCKESELPSMPFAHTPKIDTKLNDQIVVLEAKLEEINEDLNSYANTRQSLQQERQFKDSHGEQQVLDKIISHKIDHIYAN